MFFWNDDKKTKERFKQIAVGLYPKINTVWDEMIYNFMNGTFDLKDGFVVDIDDADTKDWRLEMDGNRWGQVNFVENNLSFFVGTYDNNNLLYSIDFGADKFKQISELNSVEIDFLNDFIEIVLKSYIENNSSKFTLAEAIEQIATSF